MAKGNLPNTNTEATSNSMGLNKMQPTGQQAPWQQMANNNTSYPMGIVKQGPLGPFGTMNSPFQMPNQQMGMNNPMMNHGGGQMGINNPSQPVLPTMDFGHQGGLSPSPQLMQQFLGSGGDAGSMNGPGFQHLM